MAEDVGAMDRTYAVSGEGRQRAFAVALSAGVLGAFFAFWGATSVRDLGVVVAALVVAAGVAGLAVAWFLGAEGFMTVGLDDDGIVVRRRGKARRVPWSSIARVELAAQIDSTQLRGGPLGATIMAARAVADRVAGNDPYADESLRTQYVPSARLLDAAGRRLANFPETLGWDFFLDLRDRAVGRGIEIVKKQ
jgi:hypothetical protein